MTNRKWRRALALASAVALVPVAVFAISAPANASCSTRVTSDFDGDGYADVAVGEPLRDIGEFNYAGAVQINYGSSSGITATGRQYFDEDSAGIAGTPSYDDRFGYALTAGFFNGDCYSDLAIGTEYEDDVTVLYGSSSGLTTSGALHVAGHLALSNFGAALTSGDFNHDGFSDLVVGAPAATDNGASSAGEIDILYGASTGLQAAEWMNQSTSGVPGTAEAGDRFGFSLAAGDFTGDGYTDLAIGSPYEDNGSIVDGGAVTILKGSTAGVTATGAQTFAQSSTNVPGADETGDEFGYSLAAGDANHDGRKDLVVGVPFESFASTDPVAAGDIVYLPGTSSGLTGIGSKAFSQDTSGIAGTATTDFELFGDSVTMGDFDGDGYADIAAGVSGDAVGDVNGAGTVEIIPGSSAGPTANGSKRISQDTSGVPGTAENNDRLGSTVYAAKTHGGSVADLIVAAQNEDSGGFSDNGTVVEIPGVKGSGLTGSGSITIGEISPQDGARFGATLG